MDAPSLEILAGRVDSLERENRWLKRIGVSAIVGLLAMIALGTNALRSPRELTAERFVLNDPSGHPRARLEMRRNGPALSLLSPERSDQVVLQAIDDGPSRLMYFRGSEVRASLSDSPGSGPSLTLLDPNRRSKAELFVSDEGRSGLMLHRYQRGMSMNLEADGTSKLSFLDHNGAERAGMALGVDGRALSLGKPESQIMGLGEAAASATPAPSRPADASPASPVGLRDASRGEKWEFGGLLSGRAFVAP